MLEKGEDFVPTSLDRPHKSVHPDDLICLTIDAKLKRSGGEVHLVVPPHSGGAPSPQPNPSLMKAVARARSWYERVLEGKSPLLQFPSLGIYKSNLLEARVVVTTYNHHVRLLSPERSWLVATKVYSGTGADIVMESITLIDPVVGEVGGTSSQHDGHDPRVNCANCRR